MTKLNLTDSAMFGSPTYSMDSVKAKLESAKTMAQAIANDRLLTDEGKARKRQETVDPLIGQARYEAEALLRQRRAAYAAAQEKHLEARRAAAGRVNTQRRAFALERARLVAEYNDWETVSAAMTQAVELNDGDALAAWHDLSGLLRARFDSKGGPASDVHNGIAKRASEVREALAAQRDPFEEQAAADLDLAQDGLAEVEQGLARIDWARGVTGDGPPLFDDVLGKSSAFG
jgi:hypothetical protein